MNGRWPNSDSAAAPVPFRRRRLEFKSKDHRVFTSQMQGDDGKWTTMVTVNYRRKK
ncbi:MAG: DUF1579 family protein [Opitutaceae bacterium]